MEPPSLLHLLLLQCPRSTRRLPVGQRPIGLEEAKEEVKRHIVDFKIISAATSAKLQDKTAARDAQTCKELEDQQERLRVQLDALQSENAQIVAMLQECDRLQAAAVAASNQCATHRKLYLDMRREVEVQLRGISDKLSILKANHDKTGVDIKQARESLALRDRYQAKLQAKFEEGYQKIRTDLDDPSSELIQELVAISARFASRPGQLLQWSTAIRDVTQEVLEEMCEGVVRQIQSEAAAVQRQVKEGGGGAKKKAEKVGQSGAVELSRRCSDCGV